MIKRNRLNKQLRELQRLTYRDRSKYHQQSDTRGTRKAIQKNNIYFGRDMFEPIDINSERIDMAKQMNRIEHIGIYKQINKSLAQSKTDRMYRIEKRLRNIRNESLKTQNNVKDK